MHYQSDGTQTNVRPPPRGVVGVPGWVTAGDPLSNVIPSADDPDLMNMIVDELGAIVAAAAITPDKTNNTQVLAALNARYLRSAGIVNTLSAFGDASGGFAVLPGGLIIQSFPTPLVNPPGGGASVAYTFQFPTAFPNYCSWIGGSDGGYAGFVWGAFSGLTTTGGTGYVWSQTSGTGARGHLLAIGK